jgi:hypothetical protein
MQPKTAFADFNRIARRHYKDWLTIFVLMLIIVYLRSVAPFKREFLLTDPTIAHPFTVQFVTLHCVGTSS